MTNDTTPKAKLDEKLDELSKDAKGLSKDQLDTIVGGADAGAKCECVCDGLGGGWDEASGHGSYRMD